jgi:hypothetical protein
MRNRGSAAVYILLIVIVAAVVASFVYLKPHKQSDNLLLIIAKSGSTNTAPYKIQIFDNGGATVSVANEANTKNFPPGTVDTNAIEAQLSPAGNLKTLGGQTCPKSASFGTETHVTYQGVTSGDIQCGGGTLETFIANIEGQLLQGINTNRISIEQNVN